MPQLLPARILGTTRKIFAKQFSVGSFVFFLFGTECVGAGVRVFPFFFFFWGGGLGSILLYFDDLEGFFASDFCLLQVCGVM